MLYVLGCPKWYQIAKILVETFTNAVLGFFGKILKYFRIVSLDSREKEAKKQAKRNDRCGKRAGRRSRGTGGAELKPLIH